MTTTPNETPGTIHKFEARGLGLAPYTFLGIETMVGPITRADGTEIGAPGQPMGTCQYCSTGIKDAYFLRSADGREFYVGSSCIEKAGDKGLMKIVSQRERAKRQAKATERRKKDQEQALAIRTELAAILEDPAIRAALSAKPHPAINSPKFTRLDYAEFIRDRAGLTGRLALLRELKAPA